MAKQRTLPRGTSWDDRALVLAKRLIPDLPAWLDPPKSDKHRMMLWAVIGQELAEKEPEFAWGPGRRPGSRNKLLIDASLITEEGRKKRRKRGVQKLGADICTLPENGISVNPGHK
jgi:hypothetical protein